MSEWVYVFDMVTFHCAGWSSSAHQVPQNHPQNPLPHRVSHRHKMVSQVLYKTAVLSHNRNGSGEVEMKY